MSNALCHLQPGFLEEFFPEVTQSSSSKGDKLISVTIKIRLLHAVPGLSLVHHGKDTCDQCINIDWDSCVPLQLAGTRTASMTARSWSGLRPRCSSLASLQHCQQATPPGACYSTSGALHSGLACDLPSAMHVSAARQLRRRNHIAAALRTREMD